MSMEHGWNDANRGKQVLGDIRNSPSATLLQVPNGQLSLENGILK